MKHFSIAELPDFDDHQAVAFIYDNTSGLRGFIAIHRGGTPERPAFGATRLWHYKSEDAGLRDALRLSRLMSYKAALAGITYGGGKGVIMATASPLKKRTEVLKAYAERVNYFHGRFITGTDAGLDSRDLKIMRSVSPYMVGLGGDPSYFTALGVLSGLEACLQDVFGDAKLDGRSIAIQGIGKVGMEFLKLVVPTGAKIFVSDLDREKIREARKKFPGIRVVAPALLTSQDVDIYAPCALGQALARKIIPRLKCKIVAGGANNQLEDERAGDILYERGILYAPDYVINAGGLMSVADEYEHKGHDPERVIKKVNRIKETLAAIFEKSRTQHRPTNVIADEMAEKKFNGYV